MKMPSIRKWNIVSGSVTGTIFMMALVYVVHGFTEDSTRINIRLTARIAGLIFSLAFVASSIQFFLRSHVSNWLIKNRNYLGISFAIIFLLHLLILCILQVYFHPVFEVAKTSSLIGGGMAYGFAFLMLLTSFPLFSQYLSNRQWVVLHTAGGYWIWFIFIKSYWRRANTEWEFTPLLVWFSIVLLLRLIYTLRKRTHTTNSLADTGKNS